MRGPLIIWELLEQQTIAFAIGGLVQPSKTTTQLTNLYNGSSWTAAPWFLQEFIWEEVQEHQI